MRAAIYLRQSLDRSGEGAAVSRQREDCTRLVDTRGWEATEYVDNDVSASSGKRRPAYEAMLADIEVGLIQAVVVWDLDRLHRRPIELEHFIGLADRYRIELATVTGDVDLSTDNGRLFARIKGAVARAEVERKGARQKRAIQQSAEAGRPPAGPRAFGYERDGNTLRKCEANLLVDAYGVLLAGGSLRSIATTWNSAGRHTERGNEWTGTKVRRVLQSPRYAGLRALNGNVVSNGTWPQVVSPETWRAAVALLSDESRRTTPDTRRRYPLSGLARCFCGAHVDTGRTQHGTRTLKCSASRHLSRAAEPIEAFVEEVVRERLMRPDFAALLTPKASVDINALRDEAMALRVRLDEAGELFSAGDIDSRQLAAISKSTASRLEDVESTISRAASGSPLQSYAADRDPAKRFEAASVEERRAIISALMTITLQSPGRGARRFEPATVSIDWHGTPASVLPAAPG